MARRGIGEGEGGECNLYFHVILQRLTSKEEDRCVELDMPIPSCTGLNSVLINGGILTVPPSFD